LLIELHIKIGTNKIDLKRNTMKNILSSLLILSISISGIAQIQYPITRTEPFDTTIFNTKISDSYFWMERKANEAEMKKWVGAQGKLTQNILDSIPGSDVLSAEIENEYAKMQDEIWDLQVVNSQFYYNRDIPGKGTSLCRRKTIDSEEEIIYSGGITINEQKYKSRKEVYAHKKPFVAMMLLQQGEANPHIRIYHLDKREFLPDSIGPVMFNDSRGVSMTWLPDDAGLLYTQAPPSAIHGEKYYNGKIKLHRLGEAMEKDEAVFGKGVNSGIELQDFETPYIYSFNASPYLVARIRNGADPNYAFAVHYKDLNGANTPWKRLTDYVNLSDAFDAQGNLLYAATDNHPHYTIVQIDLSTGTKPISFLSPQENVLAYADAAYNSGIVAGKDALYVMYRKVGDMGFYKIDYLTKKIETIKLPLKTSLFQPILHGNSNLVFGVFSALRSMQYMHYSYEKDSLAPLSFSPIVVDASNDFATEVRMIPSRDGKNIPVTLVYKKGIDLKGENPLLIDAYGNSGSVTDVGLNPFNNPWLNRNGIYAYAHVRGGGELGLDWTNDGQFPHKMNSVNDVVDVAEYFVKYNMTAPDKQFVMGASAGSFLVGNSINQRPDLFAGGIFQVGLPDLVTHRDAAYARERGSVGDIATKEGFESMYSLSALYHIPDNKKLPAMLVAHGGTDYIISITGPARYIATLQQKQKGNRPQLFLVDWEGGHVGGSVDETISTLKFMLWQSGHKDFQLK
jgi:prolyl oligopeptidase